MSKLLTDLIGGYQDLRRILSRELGSEQAADVAQASFERAWRYAQTNEITAPRALLFEIARRIQMDLGRWRRRHGTQTIDDDLDAHPGLCSVVTPERIASDRQMLDRLCQVVDTLPPRCREAFVLHHVHGLTHAQVAEEMHISVKAVEKHIAIALRACRTIIGD
ncbi:MAG: RNA polymerase sigma factor [Burkholderia sp.]|jgi:RNA polymerase sigma-70 factor (ECF subfamily)|uniref:RNA polymerase sigma factor n=1 Tax=Burkholderia sp. TaxID=36773 RepID=UPI00282A5DBB|nr:RNA polymerase sigma factor [Burkholderia sp.]MDR0245600.1 RNA polymerase sigma factor [Burkholderia sp.]